MRLQGMNLRDRHKNKPEQDEMSEPQGSLF